MARRRLRLPPPGKQGREAGAYAEATSSLTATTVVCAATDCLSQVCKARPVVTLPVTINKYTGVNGNNQIFQAGNLGYFMGRGVDRNLLQAPGAGLRKQAGGSSMRKKFVFATPTLGLTVKRRTQAATTYEIENIRAGLEAIISQKQEEDCVFDVVCNLVDAMGEACASLTRDDAEYLLGRFSVLADSVLETLATIASSGIEWTAGAARDFLEGVWGASAEEYSDLALFVDGGSRAHEESNVIDVVPGNLVTYAKQRLNNAILKACGQTQFYISLIQGLVPRTQSVPARDYPHVLGTRAVESAAAYAEATSSLTATTVVCAATDCTTTTTTTGRGSGWCCATQWCLRCETTWMTTRAPPSCWGQSPTTWPSIADSGLRGWAACQDR